MSAGGFGAWSAGKMKMQTWVYVILLGFLIGTYVQILAKFAPSLLIWGAVFAFSFVFALLANFWFSNRIAYTGTVFFAFLSLGAILASLSFAR